MPVHYKPPQSGFKGDPGIPLPIKVVSPLSEPPSEPETAEELVAEVQAGIPVKITVKSIEEIKQVIAADMGMTPDAVDDQIKKATKEAFDLTGDEMLDAADFGMPPIHILDGGHPPMTVVEYGKDFAAQQHLFNVQVQQMEGTVALPDHFLKTGPLSLDAVAGIADYMATALLEQLIEEIAGQMFNQLAKQMD